MGNSILFQQATQNQAVYIHQIEELKTQLSRKAKELGSLQATVRTLQAQMDTGLAYAVQQQEHVQLLLEMERRKTQYLENLLGGPMATDAPTDAPPDPKEAEPSTHPAPLSLSSASSTPEPASSTPEPASSSPPTKASRPRSMSTSASTTSTR
ncbi:hypothetical protein CAUPRSCDRAFT_12959 [Caulochytrium protostelioides]|nr:hypothetical protein CAUPRSCDRAFT_12959 [Caulochytrium protostelioides]